MSNPWSGIEKPASEFNVRLVADHHPLRLYWGVDSRGRYLFVADVPEAAMPARGTLPDLEGIKVAAAMHGTHGKIVLLLNETSNWELFYALCNDLVRASAVAHDEIAASAILVRRLQRWQDFLRRARSPILPLEEIKGLLGELLFLINPVAKRFGWDAAVSFWKGPEDAPQDFAIHDTAVEVKCQSGSSKPSVRITSVDQLNPQLPHGFLVVQTLATAEADGEGAFTLNSLKLSVVPGPQVEEVVPRISEYANTQNKVSAADFFSNHPFHLRIEEFSRRLWAPSREGGVRESHWFYERARGQYVNMQASLSNSEKKAFLLQNPRDQMFTKTDLAKFILSFEEQPHTVSLGAQKAFAGTPKAPGFVSLIAKEWETTTGLAFNEVWFKRAVAKGILFRELDRLILQQDWYNGYKANIVTYTLAKFAQMVRESGREIDFLRIWQTQSLPTALADELVAIASTVNRLLLEPPPGTTSNVSEWAKQPACWTAVSSERIELSARLRPFLTDGRANAVVERDAGRNQAIQDGIQAQTYVVQKGAAYWTKLREWNETHRKLSPREMGILDTACAIPRRLPSELQVPLLIAAEKRAIAEGFRPA